MFVNWKRELPVKKRWKANIKETLINRVSYKTKKKVNIIIKLLSKQYIYIGVKWMLNKILNLWWDDSKVWNLHVNHLFESNILNRDAMKVLITDESKVEILFWFVINRENRRWNWFQVIENEMCVQPAHMMMRWRLLFKYRLILKRDPPIDIRQQEIYSSEQTLITTP
jgi:hypothetical protein